MKLSIKLAVGGDRRTIVQMTIRKQNVIGDPDASGLVAKGNGGIDRPSMRVCAFMYPELFDDAVFLKGSHPDRDSERPAISYRSPRECYAYVNRAAAVVQIINDGNPNGCKIL